MARYSLFVLKVPLNTNKPVFVGWFVCNFFVSVLAGLLIRLSYSD